MCQSSHVARAFLVAPAELFAELGDDALLGADTVDDGESHGCCAVDWAQQQMHS